MKKVAVVSYFPKGLLQYRDLLLDFDYIVAVDSGVDALIQIGLSPNVCIGDFDSISNIQLIADIPSVKLSTDKDETDTKVALDYVNQHFPGADTTLFVSMSGRNDHQFGLLSVYYENIMRHQTLKIQTDTGLIYMLKPGVYRFPYSESAYFSCFSFASDVSDLSIQGAVYELDSYTLPVGSDRCCSNQFKEHEIKLEFKTGVLLVYITYEI